MKKDMNDPSVIKSLIKYDMAYCFNNTCPRAGECFRHQAYAYKDPAQKVGRTIFPDALQNGQCEYFLRPRVITSAWGFSHVYSQVRNCDVADLRIQIMGVLGGKTAYYRYHRGEKYLTPELQVAIARIVQGERIRPTDIRQIRREDRTFLQLSFTQFPTTELTVSSYGTPRSKV